MHPVVDVSESSRSLVVRPSEATTPLAVVRPRRACRCGDASCCGPTAEPVTVLARVIDVDVRRQVPDARAVARARQAAARYDTHGTTLLDDVRHGADAHVGRPDAPDGWTLVGHWLTWVTLLSALAVAFATYGTHAAG